tara:strand:+ start:2686 stop:2970 length:285 start_codon:yes stop_codon:yes gene_type:complete
MEAAPSSDPPAGDCPDPKEDWAGAVAWHDELRRNVQASHAMRYIEDRAQERRRWNEQWAAIMTGGASPCPPAAAPRRLSVLKQLASAFKALARR